MISRILPSLRSAASWLLLLVAFACTQPPQVSLEIEGTKNRRVQISGSAAVVRSLEDEFARLAELRREAERAIARNDGTDAVSNAVHSAAGAHRDDLTREMSRLLDQLEPHSRKVQNLGQVCEQYRELLSELEM